MDLKPAPEKQGSCTIIRYSSGEIARPKDGVGSDAALSSPHLFLQQWHLVRWTRPGTSAATLIEAAAISIIDDVRAALRLMRQHRVQHTELVGAIKASLGAGEAATARLERLAAAFGVSPFTVSRVFHREVGISMRKYGKRLRLRRADAGFFDQAHFTNAFRAEFGVPPSFVRRMQPAVLHAFTSGDADQIQHFGQD